MDVAGEIRIKEVFDILSKVIQKPENYLSSQDGVAKKLHIATKQLYDLVQSMGVKWNNANVLPELIVDGFDDEQVWQQLELNNDPTLSHLVKDVSLSKARTSLDLNKKRPSAATNKKSPKKRAKKTETGGDESPQRDSDEDLGENETDTSDSELDLSDGDAEGDNVSNESDDPLRLDQDQDYSDMSDDEKEMENLLKKARTSLAELAGNEESDNDDDEESDDEEVESLQKEESKPKKKQIQGSQRKRRTEVDDKFFQMADMEEFLDQEDAREEKRLARADTLIGNQDDTSDDDEIDYFADIPSEEEQESGGRVMYTDFFDPPDGSSQGNNTRKAVESNENLEEIPERNEDDEASSEGEDVSEIVGGEKGQQSSFQKRQQRLKEKISGLEERALSDKPWQLTGEIQGVARPENSLLQEDLEYEHTSKQAPVITEETTKSLEDLIKQRIKDKVWDDVERKIKPTEEPFQYKKRVVLDQEKSKLSLGEIYEQEFIKQQQKEEVEVDDPEHETIKKMMTSLFVKLDALSNFHYTPRPAAPEVKIINNMPSIAMEEVAPVAVSDATLLAPEEVQEKQKTEMKGATEKSQTDRNRERKEKKKRQKAKRLHKESKQKALEARGLGVKQSKEQAFKDLEKKSKTARGVNIIQDKSSKKSGLTSSTKFFTQLQEDVTTRIHKKKAVTKQKKKKDSQESAAKYKL